MHRQGEIWRSLCQTIKDRCFRTVMILTWFYVLLFHFSELSEKLFLEWAWITYLCLFKYSGCWPRWPLRLFPLCCWAFPAPPPPQPHIFSPLWAPGAVKTQVLEFCPRKEFNKALSLKILLMVTLSCAVSPAALWVQIDPKLFGTKHCDIFFFMGHYS